MQSSSSVTNCLVFVLSSVVFSIPLSLLLQTTYHYPTAPPFVLCCFHFPPTPSPLVAPPSPTRRRSRQIPVYDYSSGEENGGPPTPPLTPTRSSSRTKMATSHPLESTPTRRKGILTPQMTPSSDKAQLRKGSNNSNNSTGLTPALNRTLNLINGMRNTCTSPSVHWTSSIFPATLPLPLPLFVTLSPVTCCISPWSC